LLRYTACGACHPKQFKYRHLIILTVMMKWSATEMIPVTSFNWPEVATGSHFSIEIHSS
jgi:hypothetical protein